MASSLTVPSEDPGFPGTARAAAPVERGRFRALVQSPLRAALLRHLHDHPHQAFEVEALVQAVARIPLDIANCMRDLASHGYVRLLPGPPPRFAATVPGEPAARGLLEEFLASPRPLLAEDWSPSFRRLRDQIGVDEKMLVVLESIRAVAKTDVTTLVLGPRGAGKEVVARVIHELSRRREGPFQAVRCAALPDSLFDPEMFGCEAGGLGTVAGRRPGKLELAGGGTLFLDEVGELSLASQEKMRLALEQRKSDMDFRLVSASSRPLDLLLADRRFREDLFYRLNAFTIHLPSLRERPADIPILAARMLAACCTAQGLPPDARSFSGAAMEQMLEYSWPGNIREMLATISRAALLAREPVIQPGDIVFPDAKGAAGGPRETPSAAVAPLHRVERDHIERVLDTVSWNKKRAARLLEVSRETLYRKIKAYELAPRRGTKAAGQR